jgi:hypothetical protein
LHDFSILHYYHVKGSDKFVAIYSFAFSTPENPTPNPHSNDSNYMKNIPASKSAFSYRFSLTLLLSSVGLFLALLAFGAFPGALALAQGSNRNQPTGFQVGASYHNDVSPPLRELANLPFDVRQKDEGPDQPEAAQFPPGQP